MVELRLTQDNLKWLILSFVFVSASIFFSYFIFPTQTSILTISFVVIGLTPYLYSMTEKEEAIVAHGGKSFLVRYASILTTLLVISAGLYLSFSFWYNALPSDPTYDGRCSTTMPCRQGVFSLQLASVSEQRPLEVLLGIMLLAFALSLFLGVGAILIITWDISSLVIRSTEGPMAFLLYLPQLLALFLTAMAGALLSFAVVRHEWRSHGFSRVMRDSLALLAISALLAATYPFLYYTP